MRRTVLATSVLMVLAACGEADDGRPPSEWGGAGADDGGADDPADDGDDDSDGHDPKIEPLGLDELFEDIGTTYDVPVPLLKALSYVETRWQMIEGHEEFEGRPLAYGIMALRGERLEEAAALAGLDPELVKTDPGANIEAAAAWLDARATERDIADRSDIGFWADVVLDWSGLDEEWAQAAYVYKEVYPRMREGAIEYAPDGEIRGELEPIDVWPNFTVPPPEPALSPGPDYAVSLWRSSPNYSSRPGGSGGVPAFVIIHTCEGSYTGCYSWLRNSQSGVSAHYVVNSDGSEISQLVRESKKGWHIGAKYQCSNNDNFECWRNGASSNNFTIGIEHAGFASQASWDPGLIDASARLLCDIAEDNDIAIDDLHIVAHGKLQPYNRVDPGPNWPWNQYLALAKDYCDEGAPLPPDDNGGDDGGEEPPPPEPGDEIIVDSNNANNDENVGFVSVSSAWVSSAATAGHYGTGYWWASLLESSDPATFWFYLPEGGQHTVDAWWTHGTNRSTSAAFLPVDAGGTVLDTVRVDQTQGGGQWQELGTFNFTAGWNRVMLSRWGTSGDVVIADAIRVR